jgi:hypothetical protein
VQPYPFVVLGIWLMTAAVIALAARELWPDHSFGAGVAVVLVSGALAWGAAIAGFVATWVVAISSSLCGEDPGWAMLGPMLGVYGLVGSWALAGRLRRALLGWPLAVLVAVAVGLAIVASLPGTTGYCET